MSDESRTQEKLIGRSVGVKGLLTFNDDNTYSYNLEYNEWKDINGQKISKLLPMKQYITKER